MWARVSTFEGSPANTAESVSYLRDQIMPQARQLPGFRGVYALSDPQSGKSLTITLWDSEDELRASESEADRLRKDAAEHSGEDIVEVERFEVLVQELI